MYHLGDKHERTMEHDDGGTRTTKVLKSVKRFDKYDGHQKDYRRDDDGNADACQEDSDSKGAFVNSGA